jgi:GT2 family glycosyltransferase
MEKPQVSDRSISIGFAIVTYNSEEVLRECLASIPSEYPVVIVDNASRDRSVEIARNFGHQVIANTENLGFGAACNQAAKILTTSHVYFLNPDAAITKNSMLEIEKAIMEHPDAAAFGPAVRTRGLSKSFRNKSYILDQNRKYIDDECVPKVDTEVDFIDGAALVCNRQIFNDIGGFDEAIFLYYEDDDLCYRLRKHGKRLIYVPASIVLHRKKASSGNSFKLHYIRALHETRSKKIISQKYNLLFDVRKEKRRATIRFFRSLVTLKFKKASRYLGAIRSLYAAGN